MLLSIVIVLIILNISTLILWKKDDSVQPEDDHQVSSREDVATIGKETIAYKEWIQSLKDNHGEEHLQTMIDKRVVSQLAEENNIDIDEDIINRDIAILTTMQRVMTEEEKEALEKKWREDIIHRYQLEALLTQDVQISDEEAR